MTRRWGRPDEEGYRGPFRRDRDKILYSSAFRRLAGKTQVVAAGELGDFHTRMTHSLKVAQLGRRLAERLRDKAKDEGLLSDGGYPYPDPDLVEAACLAHDLGHPPFGHGGEVALSRTADALALEHEEKKHRPKPLTNKQCGTVRLQNGFEGNAQSFRLLASLEASAPEGSRGLDLTAGTLNAVIKYPWWRGLTGKPARKWNAFHVDEETVNWVRGNDWGPGARTSFEAQIMDWCDDVTYACHDVEDFYRAGLIPLHEVFDIPPRPMHKTLESDDIPPELRAFFEHVRDKWENEGRGFDEGESLHVWTELGNLALIDTKYRHDRYSKVKINQGTSKLIKYFLDDVGWRGDPAMFGGDLDVAPRVRLGCDLLQELIWYYVIERPGLASLQHGQMAAVEELLRIYFADPGLLPEDRCEELEEHGDTLRACVDHVASLTEPVATALYLRLTGVKTDGLMTPIWRS